MALGVVRALSIGHYVPYGEMKPKAYGCYYVAVRLQHDLGPGYWSVRKQ
jgi:hypothetical protein